MIRTALGLAFATALAGTALADDPMKVGFVYVGPVGDFGWSYQHDQGRLAVQEHFGDAVETTFVENVSEGADAERVIRNLAASGHKLIFTTSFGFMNPTAAVAQQFPDVIFEHATGYKRADNLGTYLSLTYEGRYVSGYTAASVTQTGVVGYIGSFPIPEVIRDINSVMLGMQSVNPDAELKVVWVNTWYDPGKEREAAEALMNQGADVIIQHTDSPAAMQAAEEAGIRAVGQASDMSQFGPNAHLFSVVDEWGGFYIDTVQAVMDGTWQSEDVWGGIGDGMIVVAAVNDNLPDDVKAGIADLVTRIGDGSFHPFTGPIYDQEGVERIAAGEVIANEELAGMDWYVQGVGDTLP
ncbi:MAG: BMP family ABC transporter substrate-binding protein [Alphaproteobacteria bacterium]